MEEFHPFAETTEHGPKKIRQMLLFSFILRNIFHICTVIPILGALVHVADTPV